MNSNQAQSSWSSQAPSLWNSSPQPQQPLQNNMNSNSAPSIWGQPSSALIPKQTTSANTSIIQPNQPNFSGQWEKNGQNIQGAWAQITQPTMNHNQINQIGNASRDLVIGAGGGSGPLSNNTHAAQMQIVDASLTDLVERARQNRNEVSQAVSAFVERIIGTMQKIGQYCSNIIDRGMGEDPTLSPDSIEKAKVLIAFSSEAVNCMKFQCESALEIASKGMGIINQQTLATVKVIFETRSAQVTLFEQKLKVFQNQEMHEIQVVTQVQAIKLKEHEYLFKQLLEISQLIEKQKDGESRRALEADKARLEAEIQMRGQFLKEEEVHNKHQIETTKLENDQFIANKMAEIKAKEQEENAANQRLQIIEQELTARQRDLQNAQTERERTEATRHIESLKAEQQAKVQRAQIASQERQENLKTIASVIRPPCSIQ